ELIKTARALLPAQIDRRLVDEVRADAGHLRELRPERRNDLVDALAPLIARLQLDHHAAGVDLAAAAAAADLDLIRRDVRILGDDVRDLRLVADHLVVADALDRLRADAEP